MRITPFIKHLLSQKPNLTDELVHPRFQSASREAFRYASLASGGTICLVTGPTGSGKTTLLRAIAEFVKTKVFEGIDDDQLPVIGMTAGTSQDGKIRMKYVLSELLSDLGHPSIDPTKIERTGGYKPVLRRDETSMLSMVRHGLQVNRTRLIFIDEGQFLTEHRDPNLRGTILESMKSLVTSSTDLILCGGYQLLVELESIKAHLASRVIPIVVDRYRESEADIAAWRKIVSDLSESPKLRLQDPEILVRNADQMLEESQGVIGVMERRLLHMALLGPKITQRSIDATRPSRKKFETLRSEILLGEAHLSDVYAATKGQPKRNERMAEEKTPPSEATQKKGKAKVGKPKAFQRVAKRASPKVNA